VHCACRSRTAAPWPVFKELIHYFLVILSFSQAAGDEVPGNGWKPGNDGCISSPLDCTGGMQEGNYQTVSTQHHTQLESFDTMARASGEQEQSPHWQGTGHPRNLARIDVYAPPQVASHSECQAKLAMRLRWLSILFCRNVMACAVSRKFDVFVSHDGRWLVLVHRRALPRRRR
jgi:hypothetical protein